MIYTLCEYAATIIDSIILLGFMVYSLSFKNIHNSVKIKLCFFFFIIMTASILGLNHHFKLEGIFTLLYFAILFCFSRAVLNGKWWHQLILVMVALVAIFLANAILVVISSITLKKQYLDILIMRNPARIFLLFISKIVLLMILIPISSLVRKRKVMLDVFQCISSIISLVVTIIAAIIIEELILNNRLSLLYATIIMICLTVIHILIFVILIQFSIQNHSSLNQIALQTRLKDDQKKLQESLQWSKSVRTLRHDLNNHLVSISQYIKNGDEKKALEYIDKIAGNLTDFPTYTETNNAALNTILDSKRMLCKKDNINLKCYIQSNLSDFDDTDFSTIFGNIMDNAIEAEKKVSEKEIRLSLEMISVYLHLTIQNRIDHPILINGELPYTSKTDKLNHGLGMYSATEAVARNNGSISIYEKDGWFIVDVIILAKDQ